MKMKRSTVYLMCILIYVVTGVSGGNGVCDFSDDDCVFKAANIAYPKMIAGIPGVEPSDPLHKDEILINLPRFSYKLHNVTMTGLKDFFLYSIKFYENKTFAFDILLPVTRIEAHYELHGQLDHMVLNGKGVCRLTYPEHKIDFTGKYFTSKDFVDKKIHNFVGNFIYKSDVREEPAFEYENLTTGEKELTKDELKQLDNAVHKQVITDLLNKHIDNVDDYLKIVPFSEVMAKPN